MTGGILIISIRGFKLDIDVMLMRGATRTAVSAHAEPRLPLVVNSQATRR